MEWQNLLGTAVQKDHTRVCRLAQGSLKMTRWRTGIQCKLARTGVMYACPLFLVRTRAALCYARWSLSRLDKVSGAGLLEHKFIHVFIYYVTQSCKHSSPQGGRSRYYRLHFTVVMALLHWKRVIGAYHKDVCLLLTEQEKWLFLQPLMTSYPCSSRMLNEANSLQSLGEKIGFSMIM